MRAEGPDGPGTIVTPRNRRTNRGSATTARSAAVSRLALATVAVLLLSGCIHDLSTVAEGELEAPAPQDGQPLQVGETDDGVDIAAPSNGVGDTRVQVDSGEGGLTWTAGELAAWRERARSGPYRTAGDAGRNTPGDWERVTDNASKFERDPRASHLAARFGGCAEPAHFLEGHPFGRALRGAGGTFERSVQLRDAAFVALVEDDRRLGRAVVDQLVRQAQEPTLDFTDARRWCTADRHAAAFANREFLFPLASYLTRLLFAYDYAGQWATPDERAVLDRWHAAAGTYVRNGMHRSDRLWRDAERGDYTAIHGPSFESAVWRGGPLTSRYGRHYNNRQAIVVLYVTAVGVHGGDPELTAAGRRWAKEYVRYSVYPDGTVAELMRGGAGAIKGMGYANKTLATVAIIADLLARDGDTSVYDYTTDAGVHGTAGGDKSLRKALAAVWDLYTEPGRVAVGGGDYAQTDGTVANDAGFAVAQRYYRDSSVDRLLSRDWPARPKRSWAQPWQGPWGVLPAALFQYHGLPASAGTPY